MRARRELRKDGTRRGKEDISFFYYFSHYIHVATLSMGNLFRNLPLV